MSIDALAALANVPKSGFYRHFATKDELVLDYLTRASSRFRASLAEIEASHPEPAARVRGLLSCADDNAIMLNAAAEYRAADETMTLLFSRHRQWVRQWIRNQLSDTTRDGPIFTALGLAALFDAYTIEAADAIEADQVRSVFFAVVDRAFSHVTS